MKDFSRERSKFASKTGLLMIALASSLSIVAAQEQDGSMQEMWQEQQDSMSSTDAGKNQKKSKSKSSKKTKAKKPAESDTPQEADLAKSTDPVKTPPAAQESSGWNSSETAPPAATSAPAPEPVKTSTETAPESKAQDPVANTPAASSGSQSAVSDKSPVQTTVPSTTTTSTSSTAASTGSTSSTSSPASSAGSAASSTISPASSAGSAASSTISPASSAGSAASAPAKPEKTDSSAIGSTAAGDSQALCSFNTLTNSDLVKSGGWPGVGPFSQDKDKGDVLVDESKNQIKVSLSGEEVTHAELLLVNQAAKPSQLLALQMTTDFLLEAVGAPPGKIADFNSALMKEQEKLVSGSEEHLNLKAGTYKVQIQKKPAQDSTVPGNVSYLIGLDNQKPLIALVPTVQTNPTKTDTSFSVWSPPEHPKTALSTPSTTKPPASTTTTSKTTPATTSKPNEILHRQFANLVISWQKVKRTAVKNRQSSSLTNILGGKALAMQNRAIDWLMNTKQYYEMTPIQLQVQAYKEVTPGNKYEVETFIKERQQLMSADTMKPVKDKVMAYNVVYTVEKIRGAWLITDTRMVTPQQ
ncbi:MAG: IMS domain-containing protein [Candidatus Obscuribacterales bacterium]|nr:IMS domain-containing protein [Candidatus Obscuribacterales bacterium]